MFWCSYGMEALLQTSTILMGLALTFIDCCTNCCYLPSLFPAPGNLSVVLLVVETIGGKLNAGFILLIFWRHVVLK